MNTSSSAQTLSVPRIAGEAVLVALGVGVATGHVLMRLEQAAYVGRMPPDVAHVLAMAVAATALIICGSWRISLRHRHVVERDARRASIACLLIAGVCMLAVG